MKNFSSKIFCYIFLTLCPIALFSQSTEKKKQVLNEQSTLSKDIINAEEAENNKNKDNKDNKENEKDPFEVLLKKELEGGGGKQEENIQELKSVSWSWQILKTCFILIFLLGIFWVGRRFYLFKQTIPGHQSGVMQTLYQYQLSIGRQISIVQLGENLLVLGVSDSGINLITKISDRTTIDQIKLDCEKEASHEKPDFLWELTKKIKEKFYDWSAPQKKILTDASFSNDQGWSKLSQDSKIKLQNLKEQKKFFNEK